MDAEEAKGLPARQVDPASSAGALPDALEEALALEKLARELESAGDCEAPRYHQLARESLFKELNELDGFDR